MKDKKICALACAVATALVFTGCDPDYGDTLNQITEELGSEDSEDSEDPESSDSSEAKESDKYSSKVDDGCSGLTIEDVARHPENFKGKRIGMVLKFAYKMNSGELACYAYNRQGNIVYGSDKQVVISHYQYDEKKNGRLLEDDVIYATGTFSGLGDYKDSDNHKYKLPTIEYAKITPENGDSADTAMSNSGDTETDNSDDTTTDDSENIAENNDSDAYEDDPYDGDIFPNSSDEVISTDDISNLSDDDLRIAINEIYARHGFIFKSNDLQNYFENKSYYYGTTDDMNAVVAEFNDVEKKNIKNMTKERKSR